METKAFNNDDSNSKSLRVKMHGKRRIAKAHLRAVGKRNETEGVDSVAIFLAICTVSFICYHFFQEVFFK
jgi:hypothetical protein